MAVGIDGKKRTEEKIRRRRPEETEVRAPRPPDRNWIWRQPPTLPLFFSFLSLFFLPLKIKTYNGQTPNYDVAIIPSSLGILSLAIQTPTRICNSQNKIRASHPASAACTQLHLPSHQIHIMHIFTYLKIER